jgi:hypothetical protein
MINKEGKRSNKIEVDLLNDEDEFKIEKGSNFNAFYTDSPTNSPKTNYHDKIIPKERPCNLKLAQNYNNAYLLKRSFYSLEKYKMYKKK